jgi:hypothetical protein
LNAEPSAPFDARLAAALPGGAQPLADVLLTRVALGLSHEDQPPLPLLQAVVSECEAAGMAFAAQAQPVMVAIAQLGRAAALLLADQPEGVQGAERSLVQALGLLAQHGAPAWMQRDAFLLLGDLMAHVVRHVDPAERDGFIDRGLAVARAAVYLAAVGGEQRARARALAIHATLEAERFGSVRDRHLMNAIDSAMQAFTLIGDADVRAAVRWPVLMLTMGNAALAVEPARAAWVLEARRFYTLGRSVVDVQRYPRLAAVFDGNLAMWQGDDGAALEAALPPHEQAERLKRQSTRPMPGTTSAGD